MADKLKASTKRRKRATKIEKPVYFKLAIISAIVNKEKSRVTQTVLPSTWQLSATFEKTCFKTLCVRSMNEPVWHQQFRFDKVTTASSIKIELFESVDIICDGLVKVKDFKQEDQITEKEVTLKRAKTKVKLKVLGFVATRVSHYSPLSKQIQIPVIQKALFDAMHDTGQTAIAVSLIESLEFCNAAPICEYAIQRDISNPGGKLSLVTKTLLTAYCLLHRETYMEICILPLLDEIVNCGTTFADTSNLSATIDAGTKQLLTYGKLVLKKLKCTIQEVPEHINSLCRMLKHSARKDASEAQINEQIGSVLFGCFICPLIADPVKFGCSWEGSVNLSNFKNLAFLLEHGATHNLFSTSQTTSNLNTFIRNSKPVFWQIYETVIASDGRLEACLENANTRGAFRVHLKKQMCDENLFFYEDLLLYRQNTNAAKRKIMASEIYSKYFMQDALQSVNVDHEIVQNIKKGLLAPSQAIFDPAWEYILQLLKDSQYLKFKISAKQVINTTADLLGPSLVNIHTSTAEMYKFLLKYVDLIDPIKDSNSKFAALRKVLGIIKERVGQVDVVQTPRAIDERGLSAIFEKAPELAIMIATAMGDDDTDRYMLALYTMLSNCKREQILVDYCVNHLAHERLVRTNVFLKVLARHLEYVGKDFLSLCIGNIVTEILERKPDLAVNPTEVNFSRGMKLAISYATRIIVAVHDYIFDMPESMFSVCSRLLLSSKHKQQAAALGTLFYQRYICAALVKPQSFIANMRDDLDPSRSLILLSKLLSNAGTLTMFPSTHPFAAYNPFIVEIKPLVDSINDKFKEPFPKGFDLILKSKRKREVFLMFLKKNQCAENLQFYNEVERYKNTPEANQRVVMFKTIYSRFIGEHARDIVNIDSNVRSTLEKKFHSHTVAKNAFDEAQRAVFLLMKTHSFMNFSLSPEYAKLVHETRSQIKEQYLQSVAALIYEFVGKNCDYLNSKVEAEEREDLSNWFVELKQKAIAAVGVLPQDERSSSFLVGEQHKVLMQIFQQDFVVAVAMYKIVRASKSTEAALELVSIVSASPKTCISLMQFAIDLEVLECKGDIKLMQNSILFSVLKHYSKLVQGTYLNDHLGPIITEIISNQINLDNNNSETDASYRARLYCDLIITTLTRTHFALPKVLRKIYQHVLNLSSVKLRRELIYHIFLELFIFSCVRYPHQYNIDLKDQVEQNQSLVALADTLASIEPTHHTLDYLWQCLLKEGSGVVGYLQNKQQQEAFKNYLLQVGAVHLLSFYIEVEQFKLLVGTKNLREKAMKIFVTYVANPVKPLPGTTEEETKVIKASVLNPSIDTFDTIASRTIRELEDKHFSKYNSVNVLGSELEGSEHSRAKVADPLVSLLEQQLWQILEHSKLCNAESTSISFLEKLANASVLFKESESLTKLACSIEQTSNLIASNFALSKLILDACRKSNNKEAALSLCTLLDITGNAVDIMAYGLEIEAEQVKSNGVNYLHDSFVFSIIEMFVAKSKNVNFVEHAVLPILKELEQILSDLFNPGEEKQIVQLTEAVSVVLFASNEALYDPPIVLKDLCKFIFKFFGSDQFSKVCTGHLLISRMLCPYLLEVTSNAVQENVKLLIEVLNHIAHYTTFDESHPLREFNEFIQRASDFVEKLSMLVQPMSQFQYQMSSKLTREAYIKQKPSLKNHVHFYEEVNEFKLIQNPALLKIKALDIYKKYCFKGAPCDLHLPEQIKKEIRGVLLSPTNRMYLQARGWVVNLINRNLIPPRQRTLTQLIANNNYNAIFSCSDMRDNAINVQSVVRANHADFLDAHVVEADVLQIIAHGDNTKDNSK